MRLIVLVMISLLLTSLLLVNGHSYFQNQLTPDRGFIFLQRNNTEPMPDLAFNGTIRIYHIDNKDQDSIFVLVIITNLGNNTALNVTVTLSLNYVVVNETIITSIAVNEKILLNITIKEPYGDNIIRFEIDPEDKIREENDQNTGINNNVKSRFIYNSIGPQRDVDKLLLNTAIIMALSLFFIIVAIIVIIMFFKRFRAKKM